MVPHAPFRGEDATDGVLEGARMSQPHVSGRGREPDIRSDDPPGLEFRIGNARRSGYESGTPPGEAPD